MMQNVIRNILISCAAVLLCACGSGSVPKPFGYFNIAVPDTAYLPLSAYETADGNRPCAGFPYDFDLSKNAQVVLRTDSGEQYWMNIHYPSLNADIHCSYKPVEGNLRQLTDDAMGFVYKHVSQASAIPERAYENPDKRVYGVLFNLQGNTASPSQFFVTDSARHFFRASIYCNCRPNADSLAPIYDYLQKDVIRIVESLEWK
ncbi:MAG: gliding motility lipoprotein GldD [Paludibacteraceae bacterium]|nr:gliding motility lipoprotein GldD [Paludibacteraceae bacterium]